MPRSDGARTALLDAAERLFAESGIAQTSDRKIAEAAGNSNHSAVGYYFGGREGLLHALFARHLQGLEKPREELLDASDSLLGDVRSLVLPATRALAALYEQAGPGEATWRARFMRAALHDAQAMAILQAFGGEAPVTARVVRSMIARLDHLPSDIVGRRAALMTYIITSACADNEEHAARTASDLDWLATGRFLADAIAGMLIAPVSSSED